jgi:hypothetical protein
MRAKLILAAAALLTGGAAIAAEPLKPSSPPAPASVATMAMGYIGDRWGYVSDGTGSHLILEKTGAANVPFGQSGNLEIEGRGAGLFQSGSTAIAEGLGMGHLYWRSPTRSLGLFVGFEAYAGAGHITGGLEGQWYYGPIIFTAQLASAPAVSGGKTAWWARGSVELFTTNNLMWQADVRYLSQGGVNAWLVGGGGEIRRNNSPWATFGQLRYQTASAGGSAITEALLGVHIHMGSITLRQAYSSGSVWNTLPISPF